MRLSSEKGFTLIELLVVVAVVGILAVMGWDALTGWSERNAVTYVSQNVKHLFEKYRQKAVDKGYNYGLMFGAGGVYVFEDNGGTAADRFTKMNNFAIDAGEVSDLSADGGYLVSENGDYDMFEPNGNPGVLLIQTQQALNVATARSGYASMAVGTDISSTAYLALANPFQAGSIAIFFTPEGKVYMKDPTVSLQPMDKHQFELGAAGVDAFYVVRIAFDRMETSAPEVPYYYEIAVNKYGATTLVRWHSGDGGGTWNAEIQ